MREPEFYQTWDTRFRRCYIFLMLGGFFIGIYFFNPLEASLVTGTIKGNPWVLGGFLFVLLFVGLGSLFFGIKMENHPEMKKYEEIPREVRDATKGKMTVVECNQFWEESRPCFGNKPPRDLWNECVQTARARRGVIFDFIKNT